MSRSLKLLEFDMNDAAVYQQQDEIGPPLESNFTARS
jgi:hypothetical protein